MSRLYFFNCKECNKLRVIYENQMGWLDQSGKVGYHLTIDNKPDGDPSGEWDTIIINDAMCVECDLTYGIISGNFVSKLKELEIEEMDSIFLEEQDIAFEDGEIKGHKVYKVNTPCLKCNGELLTGSQLVERALIKKESRILELNPGDTKDRVILCPTCKKADFMFDHAVRYY